MHVFNSITIVTHALKQLADSIRDICAKENQSEHSLARVDLKNLHIVDSAWDEDTLPAIRYFATVKVFCSVYNLLWLVLG